MSSSSSTSRGNLLMESLNRFFNKKDNINQILAIVKGESKISLRVIDWFVTNYSKKYNVSYFIDITNNQILKNTEKYQALNCKQFIVYIDYKLQLKGYSKRQFDPFCRRSRINFQYDKDKSFVTTIGQLNFFRWIINNKILDYVSENLKYIDSDMNTCYKKQYTLQKNMKIENQKSGSKTRRKRQELSISATKSLNKSNVKVVVSFD